jgi:uncharacterized protein
MEARNAGAERGWAAVVHLAAFIGVTIPLGNVLAPLTIWLLKRHESALLDDQGREAVNFQISLVLYALLFSVAMLVLVVLEMGPVLIAGIAIAAVAGFAAFAVIILAAVRANRGERFRYPLSIRWIS